MGEPRAGSVLLVEDNPITRKLVRYALEGHRYEVADAPDGRSAVSAFVLATPSLVIIDLLLPDMSGFDVLPLLRALPGGRSVPCLAFSGLLTASDEARICAAGFDDIIMKPVEPSRLLQIVRAHLPGLTPVSSAPGPRKRIVIADDDAVQRKLVTIRLQRAGYDVHAAADGEQALALAKKLAADAIVSDVLMPKLDGFGLCVAVRSDAALARIPVLLVTNSYLEAADHALAARAGANRLLARTPELREVLSALDAALRAQGAPVPTPTPARDLDRERMQRMMSQLERQVALHAGVSHRNALLSAELTVLSSISEAVATHHDIEEALRNVLAACFDAAGISLGALYLVEPKGIRALGFGSSGWTADQLGNLFDDRPLLEAVIEEQELTVIPSPRMPQSRSRALLERAGVASMLLAPLGHKGRPLGALLMVSRSPDMATPDLIAFAQAVSSQISLALALAHAFQEKDSSERTAKNQAAVLHSILDSMADGVIVTDEAGTITHSNPAALDVPRFPPTRGGPATWIDHGVYGSDRVTPLRGDQFPLSRAMAGEQVDRAELFVTDPTRTSTHFSVNARPLRVDGQATLGTLAAGVAHEINNPLMAVMSNLELAVADLQALSEKHGGLDLGEITEELRDARAAAERVRNIVRDLKLFSRPEEDARTEVVLEHVLESSIRMAWNEIRHRAKLVRSFGIVPPVIANESRLGQVFLNLIVNAVQALPEGRADQNEIRISTYLTNTGFVCVDVADTGQGMSPEIAARIFTPFFTTKPIGVGTGLGLAICHQIISGLGGTISVDTRAGIGTTFSVLLPLSKEAIELAAIRPPAAVPAARRAKLLVVDDEELIGTLMRRALAKDHEVHTLTDAREAARRIEGGERFDLILCDLMMPSVTGMDLHARLVEVAPDQAENMVFITGGAFTADARSFLDRVPNSRIEKPVDVQTLRRLVHERVTR